MTARAARPSGVGVRVSVHQARPFVVSMSTRPTLQSSADIRADLRAAHDRPSAAESVMVIGGGAAAVSSAVNLATTWPGKGVDLYFPRERALGEYHPATWQRVRNRLTAPGDQDMQDLEGLVDVSIEPGLMLYTAATVHDRRRDCPAVEAAVKRSESGLLSLPV